MKRGAKFLGCGAILAIAACGPNDGKLEIRSTPTPLAAGKQPVPARIAEARGLLALGNTALALQAFRIAVREDPRSIEAVLGIAVCYDRMGRHDLSRRHYEAALAIDPASAEALGALAQSLEFQGRGKEAASVRAEIAARSAAVMPAAPEPLAMAAAEPPPLPPRVAMPDAMPELDAAPLTVAAAPRLPQVVMAVPPLEVAAAPAPVPAAVAIPAAPAPAPLAAKPTPAAPLAAVAPPTTIGRSVTVKLPPPRPAAVLISPKVETATAAKTAPMAPGTASAPSKPIEASPKPVTQALATFAPAAPSPPAAATPSAPAPMRLARPAGPGPRIERLSLGEVALVTTTAPQWRPQLVRQAATSATVRFVPLRQAQRTVPVRLLNAARVDGLAARTRSMMAQSGWRSVAIGNAPVIRQRSIVLYPPAHRLAARQLARQLGFLYGPNGSGNKLTVLLGRDALDAARRRPTA